ncbi:MAG: sugar phosphate nucleotidyltransferase [Chloroflexota bacterium]
MDDSHNQTMTVNLQAVILAAGRGKRLQPLTDQRSKAMLPILGKPIIQRVIEPLIINGVSDFILVTSPEDEAITRYFSRPKDLEANFRLVHQPQALGTADALQYATPYIQGDFILSACDNLVTTLDAGKLLATWKQHHNLNAILSLLPVEMERLGSTGIVLWDGKWVSHVIEKPPPDKTPSNISSLPLYCFSPALLKYLPQVPWSPRGEYELADAIQLLIEREGNVLGLMLSGRMTLSTVDDLLTINMHYLSHSQEAYDIQAQALAAHVTLIPPIRIEKGVTIGKHCTLGPNVYLEESCTIGNRVTLQNAVVLCEASIPDGETVNRKVVW